MPPKTQLVDHTGAPVRLGGPLGRGGEAEVFDVAGNPTVAAKLYHAPRDAAQSAKLAHMVSCSSPELTRIAAWPTATLHERKGGPQLGFLMPKMTGFKELHLLYGVKSRRASFPKVGWDFLVHAAMNCAAAFDTMHKAGIVVADVNSRNVCVGADATVRLVDCDSFQLISRAHQFLCEVGVPEYTPPELHGKPFAGVVRTPNHDCFGLAVLVFHLLFMGRHPFFGRFLGQGDMPQERAIAELRFAFGSRASARLMSPPPHSMALEMLPGPVASLFETAFTEPGLRGHRPSAADWFRHLQSLSAQLATCTVDDVHKFPRSLPACPWCEAMDRGGPVFFAGGQIPLSFTCSQSELQGLLAELDALLRKPSSIFPAPAPAATPTPLSSPAKQIKQQLLAYDLVYFALLSLFTISSVLPFVSLVFAGPAAAILLFRYLRYQGSPLAAEYKAREAAEHMAYGEALRCGELTMQFNGEVRKLTEGASLEAKRLTAVYVTLQPSFEARVREQASTARDRQREAFLDSHSIADAAIPGFGRDRKARLIGMGIESAWDVRRAPLPQINGIGEKLRDALETWALELEQRFRFDAAAAVPEGELRVLVSQYRRQQRTVRAELSQLVKDAHGAVAKLAADAPALLRRAATANANLSQARADATLVRNSFRRVIIATIVMAASALIFLIITGMPSSEEDPASPVISAPVATPAARQFSESGLELLNGGAGESHRMRWGGQGTKKVLSKLVLDASALAPVASLPQSPVEVRLLVAVKDTGEEAVEVQFLVQSAKLVGMSALSRTQRNERAFVSKLAGGLLSFSISPTAKLLGAKVLQWPETAQRPQVVSAMDGLLAVLLRLLIELPQHELSRGLQWRLRSSDIATVSESSAEAISIEVETIKRDRLRVTWKNGGFPSLQGELSALPVVFTPL